MDMLQKDGIRSSSQQYVYGKLKKEQTWEEYKSMVRDKVEEEEWKHLDVNEHWHKVKKEQHSTYVECQKVLTWKHDGGLRRLLKQ